MTVDSQAASDAPQRTMRTELALAERESVRNHAAAQLVRRLLKLDHTGKSVDSLAQLFLEAACSLLLVDRAILFSRRDGTGEVEVLGSAGLSIDPREIPAPGELPVSEILAAPRAAESFMGSLQAAMQLERLLWIHDLDSGLAIALGSSEQDLEQADLDVATTALEVFANIVERKRAEQRVMHDAFYDSLSGLPNRTLFIEHLDQAMGRAQRASGYLFSVLFIDIDRFKVVNDSLGHGMGDELLITFGKRLQSVVRGGDVVARLGADEFAVLADDLTELGDAIRLADRIQEALSDPFIVGDQPFFLSASIGIARNAARYTVGAELLRDADIAMYRAKEFGGGGHRLFDSDMRAVMMSRLRLETDLRDALAGDQLKVVYQPIIELSSGVLKGYEALLRWNHPTRGTVMPGEFIGIAEETGLIVPIGRWLLGETCKRLRQMNRGRDVHVSVSINLADREFLQAGLVEGFREALEESGIPPSCLHIELTERMLLNHASMNNDVLPQLKALGMQLLIDDFGTGYSSLSRLQQLPIDSLKIDRSFVSGLGTSEDSGEIVRAVVSLAHNLGISVVAEGVETPEQLRILRELGCEYVQGYLLSRPVDERGLAATLERSDWLAALA